MLRTVTEDGFVYENPRALPRVVFADSAVSVSFSELLATGNWPSIDLMRTVLLDRQGGNITRRPGAVQLIVYHNTEVIIDANSPDGGWVVLNDVWHPWWQVDVDGDAAELLRANAVFRAVPVPPGRHRVRFTFRPLGGLWKEAAGLVRN